MTGCTEILVRCPGRPDVVVEAGSRLEAKVRAAIAWGCSFLDIDREARLYVRKTTQDNGGN